MPFLEAFVRAPNGKLVRTESIETDEIVNAGQMSKPVIVFVKNVSNYQLININIFADDEDVEITPSNIKKLDVNEVVEIAVVWHPKLRRDKPLSTRISSVATQVVKPKW